MTAKLPDKPLSAHQSHGGFDLPSLFEPLKRCDDVGILAGESVGHRDLVRSPKVRVRFFGQRHEVRGKSATGVRLFVVDRELLETELADCFEHEKSCFAVGL